MIQHTSRLAQLMSLQMSPGEAAGNEQVKPVVNAQQSLKKWAMPCLVANFHLHLRQSARSSWKGSVNNFSNPAMMRLGA